MTRPRDSFQQRVQTLRDSWSERRQVRALASAHDFDSQLRLLQMLYTWTQDAVSDITDVYGDELWVDLSAPPTSTGNVPGFSLTLGGSHAVRLALSERARSGAAHWFISVTLSSSGPGASTVAAGPQRRTGQWTRGQLEDIILSALGAYERAAAGASPGDPGP